MAAIFSFKCSECGEIHEGSPSFSFRAPDPYLTQSAAAQQQGHLDSDLCWYDDEFGRHQFIRVCLEIPIHGVSEPFLWGVWVSLSASSFQRYRDTYSQPVVSDCYFGWFCNALPYYPLTYSLPTQVHPRAGHQRPWLALEDGDHPLCVDYHGGISIQKAQEIAEHIMH